MSDALNNAAFVSRERAEQLFKAQAEAIDASQAVVEFTPDGIILKANHRFLNLTGYREDEILGRHHSIFVDPRYATGHEYAAFWQALAAGHFQEAQFPRVSKSGQVVWMQAVYTPILGLDGKPEKIVKFAVDITARKRTEDALAEKTARLDAIFSTICDGIITIDTSGQIQSFNLAAERIFGYQASEVIGTNVRRLVPESYDGRDEGCVVNYLATGNRNFIGIGREIEGLRKDNSRFPMELTVSEMMVGNERLFTGITRDITERKRAEAVLAKKNEELEVAARTDRIGAQVLLAFSQHDDANRAESEILQILADQGGYRPLAFYEYDEWRGGLVFMAGHCLGGSESEKTFRLGEGLVGEAAKRRTPVFLDAPEHSPFSLNTGIGSLCAATLFVLPLIQGDTLLGVIAGGSPKVLTERERVWLPQVAAQISVGLRNLRQRTELRALSEQLNERSRRIELQNQELARASSLKSQFLASMSHELRTPLNAIIGFSEVLRDGLLGELPREQNEYVLEIFHAGRHLLSLINDILDLSKIEAGKTELELDIVDLALLIENALTIMGERAERGAVALKQDLAPDLTLIEADGRKVRQIVYNLLSNAVKFTPRGGVVTIEAKNQRDFVEIAIRDTGIGIAPRDIDRMFRAFEQLDSGHDRKYEGTGLGLSLVKELVVLHGGSVDVESEVGKGSVFRILLPRVQPTVLSASESPLERSIEDTHTAEPTRLADAIAKDGAAPQTGKVPASSARAKMGTARRIILVVDDEANARDLLRMHLESAGFVVITASSVEMAVAAIETNRPDLITLDINMPDENGLTFLSKHADVLQGIPILVVSSSDRLECAIGLGANAVLPKPIRRAEFLDGIRSLLRPQVGTRRPYVLVVDDDHKAVRVLTSYLMHENIEVGSCYDGATALASVRNRRPDLLILDLMMPGLSGVDVLSELSARAETADIPVVVLSEKDISAGERATLLRSAETVHPKTSTARSDILERVRRLIQGVGATTRET